MHIDLTKATTAEEKTNKESKMITTDTITTEEKEILSAIKRSINYNEIVRVNDEACNHLHTVEWMESFCENVGSCGIEGGITDVWGDWQGMPFRIYLV